MEKKKVNLTPKLFEGSGKLCVIIGGQHGDEPLGVDLANKVINSISRYKVKHPIVVIPCANPVGFLNNVREFDGIDMNRDYGPNSQNHIVTKIKRLILRSALVIDIHSTPCEFMGQSTPVTFSKPGDLGNHFECEEWEEWEDSNDKKGSLRNFCIENNIDMLLYEGADCKAGYDLSIDIGVRGIISLLLHKGWLDIDKSN